MNYTTGKQLADDLGMNFTETSAKSGSNINELFLNFANHLLKNKANAVIDNKVNINRTTSLEKKQKASNLCAC